MPKKKKNMTFKSMGMINTEFSVVAILAGWDRDVRGAEGVWVALVLSIKLCFLSLVVGT